MGSDDIFIQIIAYFCNNWCFIYAYCCKIRIPKLEIHLEVLVQAKEFTHYIFSLGRYADL